MAPTTCDPRKKVKMLSTKDIQGVSNTLVYPPVPVMTGYTRHERGMNCSSTAMRTTTCHDSTPVVPLLGFRTTRVMSWRGGEGGGR